MVSEQGLRPQQNCSDASKKKCHTSNHLGIFSVSVIFYNFMHRLCRSASRLLPTRPNARYHICPPCATKILRKSFITSTRLREDGPRFDVNYFEQDASGKLKRIDQDENIKEAEELQSQMAQVEERLRKIDPDGKLEQEIEKIASNDELSSKLPADALKLLKDIVAIRKDMRQDEDLDLRGNRATDGSALQELDVDFPQRHRAHLQSFNKILRLVATDVKDAQRNAVLWTKYVRSKQMVPEFLEGVSAAAWKVLWDSQYIGNPSVSSRTSHLWELLDDMMRVRQELSPTQKLVRIESLFSRGDKNATITLWQSEWNSLDWNDPSRADFRDLGIRLYVELGRLQDAYDLALGAIQANSKLKAEDIAILTAAWAQKGDEGSLKIAWSLYLEARQRIGPTMSLEDYDRLFMSFLAAKQNYLALAVFKDMLLSGRRPEWDSLELAKKSMGLYRTLSDADTKLEDLTRISLASLYFMPRQLENKFFYASWIKRLIGMGEVDSTIPVLALMYERGIRPDALHLNGIIGAWLRDEDKRNHNLALQVGWSMVKERLKLVASRKATASNDAPVAGLPDSGAMVPIHVSKNLPPATIETFSILLLYYENRSMKTSMDLVQQKLQEAEIRPNSFFMNHLMHAELRQGDVGAVWQKFESMRETVQPDLTTFSVLWDCAKLFEKGHHTPNRGGFPSPRTLFSVFLNWLSSLPQKARASIQQDFEATHYNRIIGSFCYRQDIEGTIVALYALKTTFRMYPNEDTIRQITVQLARMGEDATVSKRRRMRTRFSSNKDTIRNMEKVSEIFRTVKRGRSDTLQGLGIEEATMPVEQKGEELTFQLSEVLRIFLRHLAGVDVEERSPQEESLNQVAWEMGTGGICMDPPLHSQGDVESTLLVESQ